MKIIIKIIATVGILRPILTIFLLLNTSFLSAQMVEEVHYLSLDGLLIYVLPFYAITILGLGLFIHKLMRPSFPSKWLYICCITGILGAGALAYKFKEIRMTQFPQLSVEQVDNQVVSEETKAKIKEKEKIESQETVASYWMVAIPNFILLFLGLGVDWRNKKFPSESRFK